MSFGFGVGDFLAVLELANKVRQKWSDAPDEYNTMKDETKNVNVLLQNVHKISQQGTLSDEHVVQVKDSYANCLRVLQRCESLADKFPASTVGQSSLKSKLQRLRLDPGDVRAVRDQLTSCVASLHALLTAIQSFQVTKISKEVDSIRDHDTEALINKIADWYCSDSFAKHQDYYLSLRLTGTGLWVMQDPKYQKWQDGDTKTLLCPGIPGSGKSVLHATLVHELRTLYEHDDDVVIAYFYCSFQRQTDQTIRNIFSALVRQMFQERRFLPSEAKALYDTHFQRRTSPSVDELENLLHSLAQGYGKVFIMIDAMDECTSNDGDTMNLLDRIFHLQQSKSAVKLLVTTRELPRVIEHFGPCPQLQIKANRDDIERYLDYNITRLPVKPHVKITIDNTMMTIQDAVKSRITDATDGMFLLARLQFDSLLDKTNPRKLQQALLRLRSGSAALETEYDKALLRIDQQLEGFREIAYKVLAWITYARRELSIAELQEAVAIYEGMDDIDHDTDLEDVRQLASVCAGLVSIDHKAEVVRLVHYTTQEYLKEVLPKRDAGELSVARDCFTYLSMEVLENFLLEPERISYDELQKYFLFWYIVKQWGYHIKPEYDQHLISSIDGLFSSPELLRLAGYCSMKFEQDFPPGPDWVHNVSPAHICAYFDMSTAMSRIIARGGIIDSKDTIDRTPLSWTANYGTTEVAKVLLQQPDMSINSSDIDGLTPLHIASIRGHLHVVEIFLQHTDIDVNAADDRGETPLDWAIFLRRVDIVRRLLQQQGVITKHRASAASDGVGRTTLERAVQSGSIDIVRLVLERPEARVDQPASGVNYTVVDHRYTLKLWSSAIRCDKSSDILKMLIEYARAPDHTWTYDELELLHWAAEVGSVRIMEYLLSLTGADINIKDSIGSTLLCNAASRRDDEVFKFLLRHPDINPDLGDRGGRTPLSHAAQSGTIDTVRALLLRPEVNVDSGDHKGRAPLSYAAELGIAEITHCLLGRSEVNPNSSDHDGRTPLSYAAGSSPYRRDVETIVYDLLASHTVQPNSRDNQGRTPLSHATNYDVAVILINLPGIDMDTSDDSGLTPFLWAAKEGARLAGLFLRQWSIRSDSAETYCAYLQNAIKDIYQTYEGDYDEFLRCTLDLLGRCLLSLECSGYWTSFAFQQAVMIDTDTSLEYYDDVGCDGCAVNPISGTRFICRSCIVIDLCIACMTKHDDGEVLGDCAGHEFFEVPDEKFSSELLWRLDGDTGAVQYLDFTPWDLLKLQSDLITSSSDKWRVKIEELLQDDETSK